MSGPGDVPGPGGVCLWGPGPGGGAWSRGVPGGDVPGPGGVCLWGPGPGGGAWSRGVSALAGGAWSWGVVSQHALRQPPRQMATVADGTHPTGMHSCSV